MLVLVANNSNSNYFFEQGLYNKNACLPEFETVSLFFIVQSNSVASFFFYSFAKISEWMPWC